MKSQEDSYTVGQLIEDLTEYHNLIKQSKKATRKQAGRPLVKNSPAATYAAQASEFISKASKVWNRIPADAFDLIQPLCEAQGEFDVPTLNTLRTNLRIQFDLEESEINAMSLTEFAKVTSYRNEQCPKLSEQLINNIKATQAIFHKESKRSSAALILPYHLMNFNSREITIDNRGIQKVEQEPQKTIKNDPKVNMTTEEMMQILLKTSVKKTNAWKRLQKEKEENKRYRKSVKPDEL